MSFILNSFRFPAAGGGTAPVIASLTDAEASGGSVDVDFTGLVSNNNYLIVVCTTRADNEVTTPTGWTEIVNELNFAITAGRSSRMQVFAKLSDGTETTVTFSGPGNHQLARGMVITGNDTTTPLNASAATNTSNTVGTVDIDSPTATSTVNDCLVIDIVGMGIDLNTLNSIANSNLTSLTEEYDIETSIGADSQQFVSSGVKASSGACGATTFDVTLDDDCNHLMAKLIIAPA